MKLGLIARADNSGLGIQTWEFYRHMKPAKTMVVDISNLNNNPIFLERYPDAQVVHGFPRAEDIEEFLQDLDCVFIAEAAYNPYLYDRARQLGVKTANQYNYEFFDWFAHPEYPKPDMFIAPSRWHYEEIQSYCDRHDIKHVYLHCPVARDKLQPREISQARVFLHNAGRSAAHDRNGTKTVIEASKYLLTDAKILIHFQGEQGLAHQVTHTFDDYLRYFRSQDKGHIEMAQYEYDNYDTVYAQGDVLLLPRRYGGNCLPMNEALSVGMPVIMTDLSPNSAFLPNDWLLPATKTGQFAPRTIVDIYSADPRQLAAKIDEFYLMTEVEVSMENARAKNLGRSISWDTMKPQYEEAFEALCNQ